MPSYKKCYGETTGALLMDLRKYLVNQIYTLQGLGVVNNSPNGITGAMVNLLTDPSGNYGIALMDIDGITDPYQNELLFAHSKIGNPLVLGKNSMPALRSILTHGIKFTPLYHDKQKFTTLYLNNGNLYKETGMPKQHEINDANRTGYTNRNVCSESKILEYIYQKLKKNHKTEHTITGKIHIYTDRYPCPSCQYVIKQFEDIYRKLNVIVYYG
ncbi:deaminase domain-containing protein [Priestia megaterium]